MQDVYLIRAVSTAPELPDREVYKVGYSVDPERRLGEIKRLYPVKDATIVKTRDGGKIVEGIIHNILRPKWKYITGLGVEFYELDAKDLQMLDQAFSLSIPEIMQAWGAVMSFLSDIGESYDY